MFSSATEVDSCLEEFARVLVASGYIGEDSCFNDADIPSMLNAFETPTALDCPGSFPVSPCGYGDLSRALEMASQSLVDSCLSDNLTHLKSAPYEFHPVKSHHSYTDHHMVTDSRPNMVTDSRPNMATSFTDIFCSKEVFVKNVPGHQVSLDIGSINQKQQEVLATCKTEGSSSLIPQSIGTHLETHSCHLDLPCPSIPGCDVFASTSDQQPSLYSEFLACGSTSPGQGSAEVLSSRPKQKRKRRSKGYAKASKAKKRKTKDLTETKTQSQPRKQKIAKHRTQDVESVKPEERSLDDGGDVPQEDSGFESADGKMGEDSGSITVEASAEICSSKNPECVDNSEAYKSLRRSSRTTRNPENYNFRLTSLVKRVETERRQQEPRQPKDKSKPAPLSKYRRRTANARERDRMKEINDAFDNLQASLPSIQRDDGKNKITKFTVLKHALNYIASLRDILGLETPSSMHDDDASSDLSSLRPGSAVSSAAEDSCSSPTSGHSTTSHISSNHFFSETPSTHKPSLEIELTSQGVFLPRSSTL